MSARGPKNIGPNGEHKPTKISKVRAALTWEFRFIWEPGKKNLALYEVAYYDEEPFAASPYPIILRAESKKEARKIWQKMAEAFRCKPLSWKRLKQGHSNIFDEV